MNHIPIKGGISSTNNPTKIMTDESLHYKKYIGYILDSTVKYTRKKLLVTTIIHIPKVPYTLDRSKIYRMGSSLWT